MLLPLLFALLLLPGSLLAQPSVATITLTWDAPVWAVGQTPTPLVSYLLERDGVEVARPLAPPYTETVLTPGIYTYRVKAVYNQGQLSEASNEARVTLAPSPLPLPPPTTFRCVLTPDTPPTLTCEVVPPPQTQAPPGPYPLRPVGTVTVQADSEQRTGENGAAVNAVDGNPVTLWHTQYSPTTTPLPHVLTLDLGALYWVDGLQYTPRLLEAGDTGAGNGTITSYRLETSSDQLTWQGQTTGTWAFTPAPKTVRFLATKARYARLTALASGPGQPWASAAEVGIFAVPLP